MRLLGHIFYFAVPAEVVPLVIPRSCLGAESREQNLCGLAGKELNFNQAM